MIVMYRRTFIIKILFFIFIKPPFFKKNEGRHSTLMFPIDDYIVNEIITQYWLLISLKVHFCLL